MGHGLFYHILYFFSAGYLTVAAVAAAVTLAAILLDRKQRFFREMDPNRKWWNFFLTMLVPLIMGLGWIYFVLPLHRQGK